MIKFIIVTDRKYFSNYVTQSNNGIIETKYLTIIFENNNEKKKKKWIENL